MVVFDRQKTGLCFTKGRRMCLYTDEMVVWLFIDSISNTYLRVYSYTVVLKIVRDRGPDIPILLNLQALKSFLQNLQTGGAFS